MTDEPDTGLLRIHHAGITVSDMDRSLSFYRDGLGLAVTLDAIRDAPYLHDVLRVEFTELRYVLLSVPGADGTPDSTAAIVELLEYRGVERLPAAARPCDPGNGHLCLQVKDARALHARLRDLGYRSRSSDVVDVTSGRNAGGRIVYVADPDGYWVEILERPVPA